jgi:hypothetical protein
MRSYIENPFTKIGLVEWLKVKALSSSPSATKKKKKREKENEVYTLCKYIKLDQTASKNAKPCVN